MTIEKGNSTEKTGLTGTGGKRLEYKETVEVGVFERRFPPIETFQREWSLLRGKHVEATPAAANEGKIDLAVEEKRTRLSIDGAGEVRNGDTRKFLFLAKDQKKDLKKETQRVLKDPEIFDAFNYDLLTHDLFKNKKARARLGIGSEVDHDEAYAMAVCDPQHEAVRRDLMPGFDLLSEKGQSIIQDSARTHLDYGKVVQGEAPASALEGIHNTHDPLVRDFTILKAKYDIFGARGHEDQTISLTATPSTFRRMKNIDGAIRDPNLKTAKERNDAFHEAELRDLAGPIQPKNPEEVAYFHTLARLECHFRVENPEGFQQLQASFDAQPEVVKAILSTEFNRQESHRATIAEYSPELMRTLATKTDKEFALTYMAHVLQEAHIADKRARAEGLSGVVTVQLGEFIQAVKSNRIDPRQTAMKFEQRGNALVAIPVDPRIVDISDLPEFREGESLRGKRVLLIGIGGGSDGLQAAKEGDLFSRKYGCEVVAVGSVRNQDRVLTNTGQQIGLATKELIPETEAVGDWRFLEKIPLEDKDRPPMYIINSADTTIIQNDIKALIEATGAKVVIAVDTGGDSLYPTVHPGFSAHLPTEITPDQDYEVIKSLAAVAEERKDVKFPSSIIAPGIDSPQNGREMLKKIQAARVPLEPEDVEDIKTTYAYARWRMDGSGSEEGRYGKTPFAWLHALNGNMGFQVLNLPKANVTSNENPWRAFTVITPAMAEIVIADITDHYAAIKRPHEK